MKTELTKSERHEVYKLALDIYREGEFMWCCDSIRKAMGQLIDGFYSESQYTYSINLLPEFAAMKPNGLDHTDVWFHSEQERINALTQCIEETKPC